MSKVEILEEESLSLGEVKSLISKIKKRDGELNFRASRLEDYLKVFVKLSKKDEDTLKKELESLNIPRLKKEHINILVTFLPTDIEDLKVVMQQFSITINKENKDKILNTIKKYK